MTVKEVANTIGVSYSTVNNCVKRLFPDSVKNGITTCFSFKRVACISKDISNNTNVQCQINNNNNFMTLRNIADVFNVSYSSVYRIVNKLFPEKIQNGKITYFNEIEVSAISRELKSDYHVSQLTFSAGEKVKNTTTRLETIANYKAASEALTAMLEAEKAELQKQIELQKQQIQNQEQQLIEQKPKVEFYDDVTGSNDTIDMVEVAKILNIKGLGRNKIFELLRNKKILQNNNQPYQKYVDAGYFRIIESRYVLANGETKISLKTVVFQKGLDFIRKAVSA